LEVTENTSKRGLIVKEVFTDLNNYMKDGVLLRQAINVLNEIDLTDLKQDMLLMKFTKQY
jgi:type I restriction enzyme M protein